MNRFYGYKHWTLEPVSRCFYVGKGTRRRPFSTRRSLKWHAIVKRYGLRVEVCFGPATNEEVRTWEIEQIEQEKTFTTNYHHNDIQNIACNFTKGGDGVSGRIVSEHAKKAISNAQQGKPKSSQTKLKIRTALLGQKLSQEICFKMSLAKKGKSLSESHRQNLWKNRKGKPFSEEHLQNLRLAAKKKKKPSLELVQKRNNSLKGLKHRCSQCKIIGHTKPTCQQLKQ